LQTNAFPFGNLEVRRDLVEMWGIEPQSCNRPFVGFGAGDANRIPMSEGAILQVVSFTGALPSELHRYTGMMGFEPTLFRSTGDCFKPG
jgi:hypothetical protein